MQARLLPRPAALTRKKVKSLTGAATFLHDLPGVSANRRNGPSPLFAEGISPNERNCLFCSFVRRIRRIRQVFRGNQTKTIKSSLLSLISAEAFFLSANISRENNDSRKIPDVLAHFEERSYVKHEILSRQTAQVEQSFKGKPKTCESPRLFASSSKNRQRTQKESSRKNNKSVKIPRKMTSCTKSDSASRG